MANFVTSDNHFFHSNIIKFLPSRKVFNSCDEMNEAMINNWNSVVQPNDNVFNLGDMFFTNDINKIKSVISRLNGNIHLIYGNHDKILKKNNLFKTQTEYLEIKHNGKNIILFHYPIENWNKMHYGSIHLHGHAHGTTKTSINNRIDVGVDCFNFTPINLNEFAK